MYNMEKVTCHVHNEKFEICDSMNFQTKTKLIIISSCQKMKNWYGKGI
jgi:hypothetical protein